MTSFNLADMDTQALLSMFDIAKTAAIRKLQEKILFIESIKSSDCCSLTINKFEQIRRSGSTEMNQLSGVMTRLVARRKQEELEALKENTLSNNETNSIERSKGGNGRGAGGK